MFQFNECDLMQPFIDAGKPVLNAEYNVIATMPITCRRSATDSVNRQFSTLVLPR
jgi:hypothetical protein